VTDQPSDPSNKSGGEATRAYFAILVGLLVVNFVLWLMWH